MSTQQKKWRVQSGEMDRIVYADTPDEACANAVRDENNDEDPASLGEILDCVEVVDGEVWYVLTERACKKAGVWAGDKEPSQ